MGGLYRVFLWVGFLIDWGIVLFGIVWGFFVFFFVDFFCLFIDVFRFLLGWGFWLRGVVLVFFCFDFLGFLGFLLIKLIFDGVVFLIFCEFEGGGFLVGVGGRFIEGVFLLEFRYCDF